MLRLHGDCTMERADEIRRELLSTVEQAEEVVVDLSGVYEFDYSLIQLLHAADRTCRERGRGFRLADAAGQTLRRALSICGLAR